MVRGDRARVVPSPAVPEAEPLADSGAGRAAVLQQPRTRGRERPLGRRESEQLGELGKVPSGSAASLTKEVAESQGRRNTDSATAWSCETRTQRNMDSARASADSATATPPRTAGSEHHVSAAATPATALRDAADELGPDGGDQLFNAIDTDGDGAIQQEEFAAAFAPGGVARVSFCEDGLAVQFKDTHELEVDADNAGRNSDMQKSECGSEMSGMESAMSDRDIEESNLKEEDELAEIRVKTMFNLVEDIQTSRGASRLLYLTNKQAEMFSNDTVPKMLQAFDVHNPSLVIMLMASAGPEKLNTLPDDASATERAEYYDVETHSVTGNSSSFLTDEEGTGAQRRLTTFFKEVLLPLAAETNAIIICNGYAIDMLTRTLAEVVPMFAARHGGKTPFTVFAMGSASSFERCSLNRVESEFFASELANSSRNWKKGLKKLRDMQRYLAEKGKRPRQSSRQVLELQEGMGNYLIVEGLSKTKNSEVWKVDAKPLMVLQNMLLQGLGAYLPTLAVRTGHTSTVQPLTANMEFAARKIPVMMLDPQVRYCHGTRIVIATDGS